MSLLANLKPPADSVLEDEKDVIGGGGVLETGIYPMTVELAYLQKSKGGAIGLTVHFKGDGGETLRNTMWITSGDAKGNKSVYIDRNGNERGLPGFMAANALTLLTVGKKLEELSTEEKVLKLYSSEAQDEVPTAVEVPTELLGERILVGVEKQIVFKQVKTDAGYVNTAETREVNEIDKFFRESDGMTTTEIRAGADTAEFIDEWKFKREGITRDRTKGKSAAGGNGTVKSGAPKGKPTSSLFKPK